MKAGLLIFLFGGIGSLARYLISFLNPGILAFPIGTFITNIAACLIAGLAAGFLASRPSMSDELKLAILTGFCGGFSTFSTFSLETVDLMNNQKMGMAIVYISGSILACIMGCWIGFYFGKKLFY